MNEFGFITTQGTVLRTLNEVMDELKRPFLADASNGVEPLRSTIRIELTSAVPVENMVFEEYLRYMKLLNVPFLLNLEMTDDGYLRANVQVTWSRAQKRILFANGISYHDSRLTMFMQFKYFVEYVKDYRHIPYQDSAWWAILYAMDFCNYEKSE